MAIGALTVRQGRCCYYSQVHAMLEPRCLSCHATEVALTNGSMHACDFVRRWQVKQWLELY
jgi:hypothetical protein